MFLQEQGQSFPYWFVPEYGGFLPQFLLCAQPLGTACPISFKNKNC